MRTSSPTAFADHLFVQALGHVLGRKSFCSIQPRAVHMNIYLCLLGKSGKALKTTAQEDITTPIIPDRYVGPKSFSPQGLLRELEESPNLNCPMGEFSTVLRGIKKGGNMADFKEIANDLLKCPDKYDKRLTSAENSYQLIEPFLSISTTCTEEEFFENLKPEMVHGGFLPRWILCFQKGNKKKRQPLPDTVDEVERLLLNLFNQLYKYFEKKPVKFVLEKDALELYNDICEKLEEDKQYEDIQPFVSRYENYIIAYACILCVSDIVGKLLRDKYKISKINTINKINEISEIRNAIINDIQISLPIVFSLLISLRKAYIQQGWELLKPCLDYTKSISHYVDEDFYIAKVKFQLDKVEGDRIQWTKLLQNSGLLVKIFEPVITTLVFRNEVRIDIIESGEGKSKHKTKYIVKTGGTTNFETKQTNH